ncbi:MAG: FUSC family protein [Xanthobacteraceae bacterium]|nr:FUSC family protein [Xanthobacteraceae bacterium]
MKAWLPKYHSVLLHSMRMTAAGTLAYASAHLLGLPEGFPAAITALIVAQSNLGGSLKTAVEQIIGSVLGAALATTAALAIRPQDAISSVAAVAIALAPLTLLVARSPGYRVAPVTALLVLVGGSSLQLNPVDLASQRILGAGLGCFVGLLVSILVVPSRAARSIVDLSNRITLLMADQLIALSNDGSVTIDTLGNKAKETRDSMVRLALLVEDAARESRARLSGASNSHRMLRTLRRIRQDIDMLRRAAREAGNNAVHQSALESWRRAANSGALTLRGISKLLGGEPESEDLGVISKSLRDYRHAVEDMRRTETTRSLSIGELNRLFSIGFALDQFRHDLNDLIEVSKEMTRGSA